MKKIGMILLVLMAFVGMEVGEAKVKYADGSASVSISGSDMAHLNNTITLKVKIGDITGDAIIGVGGKIVYDKEYLEFVSMEGVNSPFPVTVNENNQMFAGFTMTGEGIDKEANILTIVFKTIKEGNTVISFEKLELSDAKTLVIKPEKLMVNNKTIKITKKEEKSTNSESKDISKVEVKKTANNENVKTKSSKYVEAQKEEKKETQQNAQIIKTQINSMNNFLQDLKSILTVSDTSKKTNNISNRVINNIGLNIKKVFTILTKKGL